MCPIIKKKLYYLLKHPEVKYEELFKLESLELRTSIDLEEMSEDDEHFVKSTFLRYLPQNEDELDQISARL